MCEGPKKSIFKSLYRWLNIKNHVHMSPSVTLLLSTFNSIYNMPAKRVYWIEIFRRLHFCRIHIDDFCQQQNFYETLSLLKST